MHIHRKNIFWILILVFEFSFGQHLSELRTSELIEKLGWESISIDCQFILVMTEDDSISNELVRRGKRINHALVNAISEIEKTIPIHIILTRINDENTYMQNALGTRYIYKNCKELIGWHHVFNGTTWSWTEEKGHEISTSEVKEISNYWSAILLQKVSSNLPEDDAIFDNLEKLDTKKYPCIDNRTYKNNSASVNFKELKSLLGKSSESKEVYGLLNKLGNDSIHSYFNDSYFISYDTDGISLKFEKDRTLNNIFLKQEYRGNLWKKLKMDHSKEQIIKILGKPTKINKYGADHANYWYEETNLSIHFDSKKKIKYVRFGR